MSQKNPLINILERGLKFGKKALKNEFLSKERVKIIEDTNKEITDLIDYINRLEDENKMLQKQVNQLEEQIDG